MTTFKMEFHFIQIPKFLKDKTGTETKLEQWMQFISQKSEEGIMHAMKENEEIKKANEEYEYLTGEEAERRLAFLREKAIKDEITMIEGSREEGEKQKQIEIAKNMLKKGMDLDLISELTNLSIEEIKRIKNT